MLFTEKIDLPSFHGREEMDVCFSCIVFVHRTISQVNNVKFLHNFHDHCHERERERERERELLDNMDPDKEYTPFAHLQLHQQDLSRIREEEECGNLFVSTCLQF